jgi:hypothetical protein
VVQCPILTRRRRGRAMPRLIDDPAHWYDRGARMRLLADNFENIETKTAMLELADDYDLLGDRAAERLLGRSWRGPNEIKAAGTP